MVHRAEPNRHNIRESRSMSLLSLLSWLRSKFSHKQEPFTLDELYTIPRETLVPEVYSIPNTYTIPGDPTIYHTGDKKQT